ncbi:MAG: hypothetical protein ACP5P4_05165 [Steroidobacteraceae bacterium]
MALPYPNVPNLPGVPQVPRLPGVTPSTGPALGTPSANNSLFQASQSASVWGIFDSNGNQVVTPDSIYDFAYSKEYNLPTFPVQAGGPTIPTGFANYNKVELPFDNSVRMTKGGTQSDREAFIQQVEAIAGTTNLYTVVTPEKAYLNCNVTRVELVRRGASGAYFFADLTVSFKEVMQTTAQYTNTSVPNTANAADPTAQPSTSLGAISTTLPSPQLQTIALTAVPLESP